ncbi:hypothetical protein HPB48_013287 [Haemaphysalis longicornis]|uniref:Uncharacterized protein n=1 Tax=Haemaphysalis longicornis TaxID=44386 RepID=A0A9J6FEB7_HAELO|nr:hypothetical protein HPB48_013287 [Haemaphysalis longicornis]
MLLQQLTGHLSLFPPDPRTTHGCSVKFSSSATTTTGAGREKTAKRTSSVNGSAESVASASDGAASEKDVTCLTGVTGTLHRLFPLYGFISIESPIDTSVYFDLQSFENDQRTSLPSSGLQVGDSVVFDARIGPNDCKAKFRATRVARATPTKLSSSPVQVVRGRGLFYPETESASAVTLDPTTVTYRDEEPVDDLLWEVADDQEVSFDAVQTDNTWIATLVWIWKRPAQPRVDGSEDVLSRTTSNSRGDQEQLSTTGMEPRGDFGGEVTLRNVGPSSALFQPAVTSTPTFIPSPVSRNEPSSDSSTSGPPAGVIAVLIRLDKMVATEAASHSPRCFCTDS